MKISIDKISPDPDQPRKTFEDIEELSEAIKKEGLLQPLLLDSNYSIIDGERRYRASKLAGLTEVPAIVLDIDPDDEQKRMIYQLMVDVHNKKLQTLERDKAWLKLWEEMGYPEKKVLARAVGYSEQQVVDALERAQFVPKVQDSNISEIPAHIITETKALKDKPELREKAIAKIKKVGAGETNRRSRDLMSKVRTALKENKPDSEIEKIINSPISDDTYEADSVIRAIKTILDKLDKDLITRIQPAQALILSGYIQELKKHLKTFDAQEAEIV